LTAAGKVQRRVGVLGGAFDPPHVAHQALARAALEQLQLDELRLIPTGRAWHKPTQLSASEHRLEMLRLSFDTAGVVVIDPRETCRPGPSYTVETLQELQDELAGAQLLLIIGSDQANAFTTWRCWQQVCQLAIICVADRAGSASVAALFDAEIASGIRFQRLTMPALTVSATAIRQRVAAGLGIENLVPAPVARYIADHSLYQTV